MLGLGGVGSFIWRTSCFIACSQSALVTNQLDPWKEYDYIVVGGGGSGCVIARELSDSGYDTLLIERGDIPQRPGSQTLYGLRDALSDPLLSQPVITATGVRTAIANVLGGGTSVNLGIWIEESQEYYDALLEYLATISGVEQIGKWKNLLSYRDNAVRWIRSKLTKDYHTQVTTGAGSLTYTANLPELNRRQKAYANIMESIMGDWFGAYLGVQPEIQPGNSWTPYSLFSGKQPEGRKRFSIADSVLEANDRLTVLVNSTVDAIIPRTPYIPGLLPTMHEVQCVQYHQTLPSEPELLGSIIPSKARDSQTKDLLTRSSVYVKSLQNSNRYTANDFSSMRALKIQRKVCLKGTQQAISNELLARPAGELGHDGEIILSAGTIMSPWLLFKSGIGPKEVTDKLGVLNYVNNPWIGQNIQDRPTVGLSIELSDQSQDLRDEEALVSHNVALALKEDLDEDDLYDIGVPKPIQGQSGPPPPTDLWAQLGEELEGEDNDPDMGVHDNQLKSNEPSLDAPVQGDELYEIEEDKPAGLAHGSNAVDELEEDKLSGLAHEGSIVDEVEEDRLRMPAGNSSTRRQLAVANAFKRSSLGPNYYSNYFSPASLFHRKAMGFEDLFGGDVIEGIIWQSRMLFPPHLRNLPVADYLSDVLIACGNERRRQNARIVANAERRGQNLLSLCRLEKVIKPCMSNSAIWFTFLSHVKSRGRIYADTDGRMVVDPGYLTEESDRQELIENFQSLLQMLLRYSGILSQVFQPYTQSQCPAHDFRTEQAAMSSFNQFLMHLLVTSYRDAATQQHVPFATEPQILPSVDDPNSIGEYVQNHMLSMWHLVGSVSLGVVLNDEFHIPSVKRLSVIDGKRIDIHHHTF